MGVDPSATLAAVEAFELPLSAHFQRRPLQSWSDIDARYFGDSWRCLDGREIRRGQPIGQRRRLPILLDTRRTLLGDLIPQTSWGSSLANLLTKASWDRLRHPLIEANNGVCEVCGWRHETLDVHEMWDYEFPPPEEWAQRETVSLFGRQILVGLIAVCKACHECFHPGLANVNGRLQEVLERLARINNWSIDEAREYDRVLCRRGQRAGEIFWLLDLGWVKHPDGGLLIRSPWQAVQEDQRFVTAPSRVEGEPDSVTAILQARWRFAHETSWRPALTMAQLESGEG